MQHNFNSSRTFDLINVYHSHALATITPFQSKAAALIIEIETTDSLSPWQALLEKSEQNILFISMALFAWDSSQPLHIFPLDSIKLIE